jgi:malonyl-CoA O-methyltransferase
MTPGKKAKTLAQRFDKAASSYDEAAQVQAETAQHLVDWATPLQSPSSILDIGAGTGFVAAAVAKRWPRAAVTAMDSAPNMLLRARQKLPKLEIITGDALEVGVDPRFDTIFSSMLLHWLPDPHAALRRWQGWLKPGGRLYTAQLVDGSFAEWRAVCAAEGTADGLWRMPPARFAEDFALRRERHRIMAVYPSAMDFLRQLKATGTSAARDGHKPLSTPVMRRLLTRAARPFAVSYEALYIELPSSPSI